VELQLKPRNYATTPALMSSSLRAQFSSTRAESVPESRRCVTHFPYARLRELKEPPAGRLFGLRNLVIWYDLLDASNSLDALGTKRFLNHAPVLHDLYFL
jgi:hypothetical protein